MPLFSSGAFPQSQNGESPAEKMHAHLRSLNIELIGNLQLKIYTNFMPIRLNFGPIPQKKADLAKSYWTLFFSPHRLFASEAAFHKQKVKVK